MAGEKLVVVDSRLNSATEVQQTHDTPSDPSFPISYYYYYLIYCIATHIFNTDQSSLVSQAQDSNSISLNRPPLSRKEKRKLYNCGDNFVALEEISTWDKKPIPTSNKTHFFMSG